jgi:hypothetical protein
VFDQLATWVVYTVLQLEHHSPTADALHFFVMDLTKIFALLLGIIYAMGMLRAALSPARLRAYVQGKPQWLSRLLAITLGSVTPFCSCSSVPLFIGFVEAGIPLGVTFSFLIASPMINEVAVVVLANILGWKLALLYVASGLTVAYFGGLAMGWFKPERWVEGYVWDLKVGQGADEASPQTLAERHDFAVAEVREIFGRIWKWVVIGVGAGALFHGFVPQQWVTDNLGGTDLLAVPAAVLMGIPLYSNATGVIPVAEALLSKGVAMGTVLAFMMSIAALSLPEMLILRKVIRWPALALYIAILAVSFTLVGWGFNALA